MAVPEEHTRQNEQLVEKLRTQSRECVAAAGQTSGFPAAVLQNAAEVADEAAGYVASPIVDDAISTFRDSTSARKEASVDLTDYLRKAGLDVSDRAEFTLRDNNWCVQVVTTVHGDDGSSSTVGVHYDSHTGWGPGWCS